MLLSQRSDTSNLESKLSEAQSTQKTLAAETEKNKRKEGELREKVTKESAKAKELEQHKQDLAAQNEFLKNFLTMLSRLCLKTEVAFLLAPQSSALSRIALRDPVPLSIQVPKKPS